MVGVGNHRARAMRGAHLAKSAKKGTPSVRVPFKVLDGPSKDEGITWEGWLSEGAIDRTIATLRLLGWQGEDLSDLTTVTGEAELVVDEEEYNGQVFTKVQFVNQVGGGGGGPLEGEAARQLALSLRDRVRRADQDAGRTRGPAPSQSNHPDDRLPI